MAKLVATYAAGMFAVFTEDRTGMRQRALIDIGDNTPTPNEMAELAGVLSDQWGWGNQIERPPKAVKAIARPEAKRTREKEIPVSERELCTLEFLADNPKSDARQIVAGSGFEPTDRRLARWSLVFSHMMKRNLITAEKVSFRSGTSLINKYLYSLPS